jgi:NAD(P)H-flavin reductase
MRKEIPMAIDKLKAKKKIENHFRVKPKGSLSYKLTESSKIEIEYMYGGKYAAYKIIRGKKKRHLLMLLGSSEDVVNVIIKQKTKGLFGLTKLLNK